MSLGTLAANSRTTPASHVALGFVVLVDTCARLVFGGMKTRLNASRSPQRVTTRVAMKSQAHSVVACALRNSSQLRSPRTGPLGNPASRRMFTTVDRETLAIPNFLSSPSIRV